MKMNEKLKKIKGREYELRTKDPSDQDEPIIEEQAETPDMGVPEWVYKEEEGGG